MVAKSLENAGGYITDDSEMAISVAFSLIESDSMTKMKDKTAKWLKYWIRSNPFDVGFTTRIALDSALDS